ncbi:MoaD/ThiS family protein [Candidatus Woesearchaeota archaeon]|nr:MoaD/ThiS family protein [Candidatus Woesearchaeota archaeon]
MIVYLESTEEEKRISFSGTVKMLLAELRINPHTVLVARYGQLLVDDDTVSDTDRIEILSVISGG